MIDTARGPLREVRSSMYVVSAAMDDAAPETVPDGLDYGVPSAFKGCAGFYHRAGGSVGVVLCAPWGFEDLIMRKSWRLLAEAIAKAGYPCLRFDYPGTGDSLGRSTDIQSASEWINSIGAAADVLRLHSGARRFIFIGQSLGATLAVEAARRRGDVIGLQLIAPVVSGRAYVRELSLTSTMVTDKIGIKSEPMDDEGLGVMGFSLSHAMVESLKRIDLRKMDALDTPSAIIFDQADRKAGAEAAEHLRALGAAVDLKIVEPYHLMISDATIIQSLPVKTERVIAGLREQAPMSVRDEPSVAACPATLVGDGFREEPVRYGPGGALFGILCRPSRPRPGAPAYVLLNRGLNPHIGWRRVSVDHARGLAAAGYASLRIDVAGLGESRDEPGRPVNLIYSDLLLPDIGAAIDVLAARGFARIGLAGVCSGAYMALVAALDDARVTDVVVVNAQRFVWNPRESVEDVIRYGLRSVNDYVGDIKSKAAWSKLIRSRHRIVPALRFLAARNIRNALARVPLGVRSAIMRGSMAARVNAFFMTLAARGTRVSLIYCVGDPGLMELRTYFGEGGRDLRFPNVAITILEGADHNLTATWASNWMLEHMVAFSGEAPPSAFAPMQTMPARPRVACTT